MKILREPDGTVVHGPLSFSSKGAAYEEIRKHAVKISHEAIRKGASGHEQTLIVELTDDFGCTAISLKRRGVRKPGPEGELVWYERPIEEFPVRIFVYPDFGGAWMWDEYGINVCPDDHGEDVLGIRWLEKDFEEWQSKYELGIEGARVNFSFDWKAFHSQGLELCGRLKQVAGDRATIFYVKAYEDPDSEQFNTTIFK